MELIRLWANIQGKLGKIGNPTICVKVGQYEDEHFLSSLVYYCGSSFEYRYPNYKEVARIFIGNDIETSSGDVELSIIEALKDAIEFLEGV